MKIKIVKQPAVTEEIEIQLPCYRQDDTTIAYITEKMQMRIWPSINSLSQTIHMAENYLNDLQETATKEEFEAALSKHIAYLNQFMKNL